MVEHMQSRDSRQVVEAGLYMGPYAFELSPEEFVRRNIRITPLPRPHQSPARLLAELPECVAFSSDYAHNEGSGTPTAYYEDLLADIDEDAREQFFGRNIAASFEQMGDPLTIPTRATT
jgi:hypothetical protein